MIKPMVRRLAKAWRGERASVFLEYALLLAFVIVIGCSPLLPGGPIYQFLQRELAARTLVISLPIF